MKKQSKKWTLVALLAMVTVALPLVGCKQEVDSGVKIPADLVLVRGGSVDGTEMEEGVFKGRKVTLDDFYIGKYEVTQAEWKEIMTGNKNGISAEPSNFKGDAYPTAEGEEQEKRPVEMVSWYEVVVYCNRRSIAEGLEPCYKKGGSKDPDKWGTAPTTSAYAWNRITCDFTANGYRLPREVEWEYAARGGDQSKTEWNYEFSGAPIADSTKVTDNKNPGVDNVGWYKYNIMTGTTGDDVPADGTPKYSTHQVGKKAPNSLGLYDMTGNVRELCWDLWSENVSADTPKNGPWEIGDGKRVYHGGAFNSEAKNSIVGNRWNEDPYSKKDSHGFRVVRGL